MARVRQQRDPRSQRTVDALHSALLRLAMQRRYGDIRVEDILRASDVSRSTFYEHFAGKDALLVSCMDSATSLLAGLAFEGARPAQVAALLAHFWERRVPARSLFQGLPLGKVRVALIRKVESRLVQGDARGLALPPALAASSLADAILSPVVAWLAGAAWCPPDRLADGLHASATGLLSALSANRPLSGAPYQRAGLSGATSRWRS